MWIWPWLLQVSPTCRKCFKLNYFCQIQLLKSEKMGDTDQFWQKILSFSHFLFLFFFCNIVQFVHSKVLHITVLFKYLPYSYTKISMLMTIQQSGRVTQSMLSHSHAPIKCRLSHKPNNFLNFSICNPPRHFIL